MAPAIAASPAARPWVIARPRKNAMSGPGVRAMTTTASAKGASTAGSGSIGAASAAGLGQAPADVVLDGGDHLVHARDRRSGWRPRSSCG